MSFISARAATRTVVFLGDSLTYGFGLEDPAAESYPGLIARRIREQGLPWKVVNAGISGDTSAGGLRRVDWVLRQRPDLLVVALGANDGLRGIPPDVTRSNLSALIDRVRQRSPDTRVVLAGMEMPEILGRDYVRAYNALFPALAKEKDVTLIPFLLEGVGGEPSLNQPDGIHPNAEGARRVADTVWKTLAPLLTRF